MVRLAQPAGDAGSRSNLINRKGNVENVDQAFSGIINVYALVPKGKPISLEDFTGGVGAIPISAPIYSQSNKIMGMQTPKGIRKLAQIPESEKVISYDWSYNGHLKADSLYRFINGKKDAPLSMSEYERKLSEEPALVNIYDINDPTSREKIKGVVKILEVNAKRPIKGTPEYQALLFKEASRMHVPISTVIEWINNSEDMIRTFKIRQDARKNAIEAEAYIEKMVEDKNESLRPIIKQKYGMTDGDINKIINKLFPGMQGAISTPAEAAAKESSKITFTPLVQTQQRKSQIISPDIRPLGSGDGPPRFQKILTEAQARNVFELRPSTIRYRMMPNNTIEYYVDTSGIERRKKINKVNVERNKIKSKKKIICKKPQKCSRSSLMKKKILSKLKCKCRGRR
jgi:hypothetical protein